MIFFYRRWQWRRAKVKIAGLRVRLAAVKEMYNALMKHGVPGYIIRELIDIPQEIAELEAQIELLEYRPVE